MGTATPLQRQTDAGVKFLGEIRDRVEEAADQGQPPDPALLALFILTRLDMPGTREACALALADYLSRCMQDMVPDLSKWSPKRPG